MQNRTWNSLPNHKRPLKSTFSHTHFSQDYQLWHQWHWPLCEHLVSGGRQPPRKNMFWCCFGCHNLHVVFASRNTSKPAEEALCDHAARITLLPRWSSEVCDVLSFNAPSLNPLALMKDIPWWPGALAGSKEFTKLAKLSWWYKRPYLGKGTHDGAGSAWHSTYSLAVKRFIGNGSHMPATWIQAQLYRLNFRPKFSPIRHFPESNPALRKSMHMMIL